MRNTAIRGNQQPILLFLENVKAILLTVSFIFIFTVFHHSYSYAQCSIINIVNNSNLTDEGNGSVSSVAGWSNTGGDLFVNNNGVQIFRDQFDGSSGQTFSQSLTGFTGDANGEKVINMSIVTSIADAPANINTLTISYAGTPYAVVTIPVNSGSSTITYQNGASGNLSAITFLLNAGQGYPQDAWQLNIPNGAADAGILLFQTTPSGGGSGDITIGTVAVNSCSSINTCVGTERISNSNLTDEGNGNISSVANWNITGGDVYATGLGTQIYRDQNEGSNGQTFSQAITDVTGNADGEKVIDISIVTSIANSPQNQNIFEVHYAGTQYASVTIPVNSGSSTVTYLNGATGNLSAITFLGNAGGGSPQDLWQILLPDSAPTSGTLSFETDPVGGAAGDITIGSVSIYSCDPGVISGSVFEDTNGDEIGDVPQVGSIIQLCNADGSAFEDDSGNQVLATTNNAGSYSFLDIPFGDYLLKEIDAAGFEDVFDSDETPEDSNDGDLTVDDQIEVSLISGETDADNNFINTRFGTISGNVGEDTDNDDNPNQGIGNVEIQLYNAADVLVDVLFTNSSGNYLFADLSPGTYTIVQIQPDGLIDVSEGDNLPDLSDATGPNDPIDNTLVATVLGGENDQGNDFVEESVCANWVQAEPSTLISGGVVVSPGLIGTEADLVNITFIVINTGVEPLTNINLETGVLYFTGLPAGVTLNPIFTGDPNNNGVLDVGEVWFYSTVSSFEFTQGDSFVITAGLAADTECGEEIGAAATLLFTSGVNMDVQIQH